MKYLISIIILCLCITLPAQVSVIGYDKPSKLVVDKKFMIMCTSYKTVAIPENEVSETVKISLSFSPRGIRKIDSTTLTLDEFKSFMAGFKTVMAVDLNVLDKKNRVVEYETDKIKLVREDDFNKLYIGELYALMKNEELDSVLSTLSEQLTANTESK